MQKDNSPLIQITSDPDQDAWLTAFFFENQIDPFAYPIKVAPREQVEFMVYLEKDEIFYPCSDKTFETIMSRNNHEYLHHQYFGHFL